MTDNFWKPSDVSSDSITRDLMRALAGVNLPTRQGLYVLSKSGTQFGRGSWSDCLFGLLTEWMTKDKETRAYDTITAAKLTKNSIEMTHELIYAWDGTVSSFDQEDANRILVTCLEEVGLSEDSPPWVPSKKKVRIVDVRVYTSAETLAVEELRAEIEAGVFNNLVVEAEKILCNS